MKIKVQCNCGTRFEFEVEPVNERMPVPINCPGCNTDATELANAVIRRQLAALPPAPVAPVPVAIPLAPAVPIAQPAPPPTAIPAAAPAIGLRIPNSPSVPAATAPAPAPTPVAAAPAPSGGLRIAKSHAAPAAAPVPAAGEGQAEAALAPESASIQFCPKHKGEPAVDSCVVCGKPLCLKCMEQFGHVCSVFCRQQAEQKRIYIPAYAGQRSVVQAKSNTRARMLSLGVGLLVVAVLGLWFYYAWFAREPKIVYKLTLGNKNDSFEERMLRPPQYFKLIGPNQLFAVSNKIASLIDVAKQQPLWSTPLKSDSDASAKGAAADNSAADSDFASEEDYELSNPLIAATTNDLWLSFGDRVIRLDRQTGAGKDTPIHGRIISFKPAEDSILCVFNDSSGKRTLARVSLPDGNIQTAFIAGPGNVKPAVKIMADKKLLNTNTAPAAPAARSGRGKHRSGDDKIDQARAAAAAAGRGMQGGLIAPDQTTAAPPAAPAETLDELESLGLFGENVPAFTASGAGVVQFKAQLLEHKTVTHQAMKAKPAKSVLEGNVTASQGLDLAQEMMNDAQRERTGGVETEDVSRYQVTLHRWFSGETPDWTGEVTGPPRFYALKTMDLLVAGQSVTAFDRNNKKLWEGKLSYPMSFLGDHPPLLETKDSVYVADPGVLTCFDRANGNARWRLNSVGISSIHTDARDNLYLTTTTAGPEKIKFSQEHNIHEKIHSVIMKVDHNSGRVLWRQESLGDTCLFSGKFLYTTWVTATQSALKLEEGPDVHYNLYLLNPSSGSIIWNFHVDNQHNMLTEVQQNWILLRFEDRLYVLKFFTL